MNFKHGEAIEFYADSKEEYETWLRVLNTIIHDRPDAPQWLGREIDADQDAPVLSRKTSAESVWVNDGACAEEEAEMARRGSESGFKVLSVKRATAMAPMEKKRVSRKVSKQSIEPVLEPVVEASFDDEIDAMMEATHVRSRTASAFGSRHHRPRFV
jgi:hypothetical protein